MPYNNKASKQSYLNIFTPNIMAKENPGMLSWQKSTSYIFAHTFRGVNKNPEIIAWFEFQGVK